MHCACYIQLPDMTLCRAKHAHKQPSQELRRSSLQGGATAAGILAVLTWTAHSEGDVPAVLAPGDQVYPEALWVSCDGRGSLFWRRQHQIISHVHQDKASVVGHTAAGVHVRVYPQACNEPGRASCRAPCNCLVMPAEHALRDGGSPFLQVIVGCTGS